MKQIKLRRILGALAGGTAAYALVLNLFLLAILTAPRAYADLDVGHTLCITSQGTTAPDGSVPGDAGSGTSQHCPMCLGRAPVGLPPQLALRFERLAIRLALVAAPAAPVMRSTPVSAHRARGPPQLI